MTISAVTLDDKYTLEKGRVFISGTQALVRLPLMQRARDAAAGLNTAGFISGYRGSPLGSYDAALWRAKPFLDENHIHFRPGVNEELAATSLWGSQQVGLFPGARYDGVFGIWYGKGPGVDRAGDAFKHGNLSGSAKNGGVLVMAGDDHGAKSSTTAHQSDQALIAAMIPVFNPASVQDYVDFGLYGWALSRFSGLWVGFKCLTETIESTASVEVDPRRVAIITPNDVALPPGGLNIRQEFAPLVQEDRLISFRLPAARAFARANRLDKPVWLARRRRLGIVTAGKSYHDTLQALTMLGIDQARAADLGINLYKVAMTWPLETEGLVAFAQNHNELFVIEEKRPVMEDQIARALIHLPDGARPRLIGKTDTEGRPLLPIAGELSPETIARAIAGRLGESDPAITERAARLEEKLEQAGALSGATITRLPYFCSGCPHNTSTRVPEGSMALAGIGCHTMALAMPDRPTAPPTQMGGEGANWIGMAPFTQMPHVFQNLGDGTYFHSGLAAIRAAIAAGVNITYKILYNDAVAMTGGQPHDGELTVPEITRQVAAEGVSRIVVVTDQPDKYPLNAGFAPGVSVRCRDELDAVQRELRAISGVTILVYDQTCAAEKRRRRKRGLYPDPPKRVFINDEVCEGCGDCSVQSNCVSIEPLETGLGRKRVINQSSCNKDYSCLKGFCPSFVTVHGGHLRRAARRDSADLDAALAALPPAEPLALTRPFGLLVTGIGGTGVVTVGALIGMAAHLEGKGVSVLDMTGLAQKNGAVVSHLRIAPQPQDLHATRLDVGEADLVLGCDMVVAGAPEVLSRMRPSQAQAVINSHLTPTATFQNNPDIDFHEQAIIDLIARTAGAQNAFFIDATALATALTGDAIATNLFMLGVAAQRGLLPVGGAAIEQAVALNGVAVEGNLRAFALGRLAAHDEAGLRAAAGLTEPERRTQSLGEMIDDYAARLTDYQDAAYAGAYRALVGPVAAAEQRLGLNGLTQTVARAAYRLMAYKDEYEVARAYADPAFRRKLEACFTGDYRLKVYLAPPLISPRDPLTGQLRKRAYGGWVFFAFRLLARLRRLRGTPFDPFGRTAERRLERQLIADYRQTVGRLIEGLSADNHPLALQIAALPEKIRGFGHVKQRQLAEVKIREKRLMAQFERSLAAQAAQ